MIPPQRPSLFGPKPGRQQQDHVGVQGVRVTAGTLLGGRAQQLLRLLDRQRLRRSSLVACGRPDQRGHIPADQIVGLSVPDRPDQAVVRDLQRPRRQVAAQLRQRRPDVSRRQLLQRPGTHLLGQRLYPVLVQLDGAC